MKKIAGVSKTTLEQVYNDIILDGFTSVSKLGKSWHKKKYVINTLKFHKILRFSKTLSDADTYRYVAGERFCTLKESETTAETV